MRRILLIVVAAFLSVSAFAQRETERVLLPVFTTPVHGAHGSEFHTDLRVANTGETAVTIDGLTANCPTCLPPFNQYVLAPGEEIEPSDVLLTGNPGRFITVATDDISSLAMNLRVYDVTRDASNFGTEIPIVREQDFTLNHIVLVGIPTGSQFRNTLRIYAQVPGGLQVTIGNRPPVKVELRPGRDVYEPAYAMLTDFPVDAGTIRVTIELDPDIVSLLPIEIPLWAMVTVTNNETQMITTITPQP
jgi:hypothetical protein